MGAGIVEGAGAGFGTGFGTTNGGSFGLGTGGDREILIARCGGG
jgi:hypothetical protein